MAAGSNQVEVAVNAGLGGVNIAKIVGSVDDPRTPCRR